MGRPCIKCGSRNQSIKYHVGRYKPAGLDEAKGPRCNMHDFIQPEEEHLHYYCQCGYQWVADTLDKGEGRPTKLSFVVDSSNYDERWAKWVDKVLLDGKPLNNVVEFDLKEQTVTIFTTEDSEELEYEDKILRLIRCLAGSYITYSGDVEIIWKNTVTNTTGNVPQITIRDDNVLDETGRITGYILDGIPEGGKIEK